MAEPISALSSAAAGAVSLAESSQAQRVASIMQEMDERIYKVAGEYNVKLSQKRCMRDWKTASYEFRRRRGLMRLALRGFINSAQKRGWNAWLSQMVERAMALARLRMAMNTFMLRGARRVLNVMIAHQLARRAMLRKMKYAARTFVNMSLRRGWNKLAAGGQLFRKMKAAARSLMYRNVRKGVNAWKGMVLERARALLQLRAAAGTFKNRGCRKALNLLIAQQATCKAQLARLQRAASSFVNRAARKGWNKLAAGGRLLRIARHAASAIRLRKRRMGLNSWSVEPHTIILALCLCRTLALSLGLVLTRAQVEIHAAARGLAAAARRRMLVARDAPLPACDEHMDRDAAPWCTPPSDAPRRGQHLPPPQSATCLQPDGQQGLARQLAVRQPRLSSPSRSPVSTHLRPHPHRCPCPSSGTCCTCERSSCGERVPS